MPRRRALRMLGGALVAVAVPNVLRPGRAQAHSGGFTLRSACNPACSGTYPVKCVCPAKGGCYIGGCGEPGSTCCCFEESNAGIPGAVVCAPGYSCGGGKGKPNCVCQRQCGTECCKRDEFCANRRENLCCKRGRRGCGLECCQPNEECRTARIGTGSADICTRRCPSNRAWCGRDKCCPPRWKCINERTGLCKRCWPEEEECEKKCCDRKTTRCCGKAGCCPKDRSCCVNGPNQVCCPRGTKCAIPILQGNIGVVPDTKAICCPQERLNNSPKLCCPSGQVALNSPGFRIPPPGISPYCCPPSMVCQSGGNKVCVDRQTDAANCGSCGNRCQSGICSRGVCALP
jgi:hypothetical protein